MTASNLSTPAEKVQLTEEQAITRLKQGDLAGLETLVQEHQSKAVHAALLIVGDPGTAEDIVQDAFLRATQKIHQFDDRRPFSPWFLKIVINAALKTARQHQRSEPIEEEGDSPRLAAWLIDPRQSPEEQVETTELRAAIWQALAQLTPNQRAAVVLRYFLDQSEREMIQELDRPLTTVKWWLHTARQKLRELLAPVEISEPEYQEIEHE